MPVFKPEHLDQIAFLNTQTGNLMHSITLPCNLADDNHKYFLDKDRFVVMNQNIDASKTIWIIDTHKGKILGNPIQGYFSFAEDDVKLHDHFLFLQTIESEYVAIDTSKGIIVANIRSSVKFKRHYPKYNDYQMTEVSFIDDRTSNLTVYTHKLNKTIS